MQLYQATLCLLLIQLILIYKILEIIIFYKWNLTGFSKLSNVYYFFFNIKFPNFLPFCSQPFFFFGGLNYTQSSLRPRDKSSGGTAGQHLNLNHYYISAQQGIEPDRQPCSAVFQPTLCPLHICRQCLVHICSKLSNQY